MRMSARNMIWGSGILLVQFCGFLVVLKLSWSTATQAVAGFLLFALLLATYLFTVHRLYRPLRELMERAAGTVGERLRVDDSSWPEEVKRMAEIVREDDDRWVERCDREKKEAMSEASRDEHMRSQWALSQERLVQGRVLVNEASQLNSERHAQEDRIVELVTAGLAATNRSLQLLQSILSVSEEVTHRIVEIRRNQELRVQKVAELAQRFDDIGETLKRIRTITDQTKIIAFNAGIEAASGGDAGKRFSIVASDIRKLAQNSEDAYEEIHTTVRQLRSGLNDVVNAAVDGGDYVNETVAQSHGLRSAVRDVTELASAMRQGLQDLEIAHREVSGHTSDLAPQLHSLMEMHQEMTKLLKPFYFSAEDVHTTHLTDRSVS